MKKFFVLPMLVFYSGSYVLAQAEDVKGCAALSDDVQRLACYDAINGKPAAGSEQPSATTKEMVATSFAPGDFKKVDTEDLFVAPNKFLNKPIEIMRAHCFYADVKEYRCLAAGSSTVAIFASDVAPADAKATLESDCGSVKASMTTKCIRTLHLVPASVEQDAVGLLTPRMLFRTAVVTIVGSQKAH